MAAYDLTNTIAPFLDRHMVLPLLEGLQEKKIYPENDILHAKLDLVSKTKMVDFAAEEYKKLHNTESIPASMAAQGAQVHRELVEWKEACGPLLDIVTNDKQVDELRSRSNFTLSYLRSQHKVTEEHVAHLYRYAKLNYDCGQYKDAGDLLSKFRILNSDPERRFQALWGKLAAEILMVNWEVALEDLNMLKEEIDTREKLGAAQGGTDFLQVLQQRTWLIHWSMFIFFKKESAAQSMFDFLSQDKLLNCVQTTCPHILRYLTTAALLVQRDDLTPLGQRQQRKNTLKDVIRVLTQEQNRYTDPITEFVLALHVDFDFEAAHTKLKQCEKVLENDFFLAHIAEHFMKTARQSIFDTYCRIHRCIDISTLAARLDIDPNQAEPRIVEMIKEAGALKAFEGDAKIDSKQNQVVMTQRAPSIYQEVISKTQSLAKRTNLLFEQIDKKYSQRE